MARKSVGSMNHIDYESSASISHLNSIEGIQFDGRAYALYGKIIDSISDHIDVRLDPNFKIHDSMIINFQIQTFAHDGLVLWVGDPLPDSSFTIEIQNRQVSARSAIHTFSIDMPLKSDTAYKCQRLLLTLPFSKVDGTINRVKDCRSINFLFAF